MSESKTESETEKAKEHKNATATATQDAPPKPHKKSKYVMLAEGQPYTVALLSSFDGNPTLTHVNFTQGVAKHVVPEDSDEAGAIGEKFADSLVDKGLLVYCDAPDKDAKIPVALPAPETPLGDMLANGVMVIGENGVPVLAAFPPHTTVQVFQSVNDGPLTHLQGKVTG